MSRKHTFSDLKELYAQGRNIMKLLRQQEGKDVNSIETILSAYDLQAGSYLEDLVNPELKQVHQNQTAAIAAVLNGLDCRSILDAGVGEATTLVSVVQKMERAPRTIFAFDLSWSRIAYAKQHARSQHLSAEFFVGNLLEIPLLNESFDIVYTVNSIEPNRGREKEILKELYRITKKYLVLFEPSNELGNEATKRHIEEHKYCKNLYACAKKLGFKVKEHRVVDPDFDPKNGAALMIIEKENVEANEKDIYMGNAGYYACPTCKGGLILHKGNLYCENCCRIFPIISGIPCLLSSGGILGSKYLELS